MRRTETDAAGNGIETLRLTATLSGVPLYRALGYSEGGQRDLLLGSVRFGCLEMSKCLRGLAAAA